MTPDNFVQAVNDELRGLDDSAPASGTDEYNYWLRVANRLRRELYRDTSKQWAATWQVVDLGAVTADPNPMYAFADGVEFLSPSNSCYVLDIDNHRYDFDVVKPQEKARSTQQVYVAGQPQKVYFNLPVLNTDQIVGGHLYLPAYIMPADITASTTTIIVDDVEWLVVATAAKLAFNDITYEDKVADLNSQANSLFSVMVRNNRRGNTDDQRRSKMYSQHKIRSARTGR